ARPPMADQRSSTGNLLDLSGKGLALAVVLLPVAGILMRWVSFSFDLGLGNAYNLASAAQLSQLVGTSLRGLLNFSWVPLALAIPSIREWARRKPVAPPPMPPLPFTAKLRIGYWLVTFVSAAILLIPDFPFVLLDI